MTVFTRGVSSTRGITTSLDVTHHDVTVMQMPLPPVQFYNTTRIDRDAQAQTNGLTLLNMESGFLEMFAGDYWVPFVHVSTTPAYGDSLAFNPVTARFDPSPTTNPTVDSLRIYGSSTTALEVKRVYSDTGGSHASSTGSMDAVGVHTLTGSSNVTYTITIDSSGTQDWFNATFTWTDATSTYTKVPVYSGSTDGRKVLAPIELSNGVFVLFTVGNYVNGETWTVTAIAASNQIVAMRVETNAANTASNIKIIPAGSIYDTIVGLYEEGYPGGGSGIYIQKDTTSALKKSGLAINGTAVGLWYVADASPLLDKFYLGTDFDTSTGASGSSTSPSLELDNLNLQLEARNVVLYLDEVSTPSAGAANRAKFYAKDKSSETIPYWRNSTAEYEIGLLGTTAAPIGADYLVGTTQSGLTNEIVVGTTPGGELGGTWASPTVDTTHSGSSHAGVVSTHEAAADPHTGYVLESLLDAKGDLIAASAADTPAKLTVGANDTILMADSSQTAGLRWAAPGPPVQLDSTLSEGTLDTWARSDHVHYAIKLTDGNGGTTRVQTGSSSPHVSITGDLDVSAHIGVGAAATVGTAQVVLVQENPTDSADWKGTYVTGTITPAASAAARTYIGADNILANSGNFAIGTWLANRTFHSHNTAATVTTFTGTQTFMFVGSLFGSTTAAVATSMTGHDINCIVNPDTTTASQTPVGTLKGQQITVTHSATANAGQTATITTLAGLHVDVNMGTSAQQRCTTMTGIDIDLSGLTAGTITTLYGLRMQRPAGSTITTQWGIWQDGALQANWLEGRTEFGATTANTAPSITTSSPRFTVTETTLANPVFRLRSTATNDDPSVTVYHGRAATTNGAATTFAPNITLAASTTYFVTAYVTARRTGGVAGTAHDGAAYVVEGVYQGADGVTAVLIGAVTTTVIGENQAAWTSTLTLTGATLNVSVTGAANNDVTWHAEVWVRSVGT